MSRVSDLALVLQAGDPVLPPEASVTLPALTAALAVWAIVAVSMALARIRRAAAYDATARCRIAGATRR